MEVADDDIVLDRNEEIGSLFQEIFITKELFETMADLMVEQQDQLHELPDDIQEAHTKLIDTNKDLVKIRSKRWWCEIL